LKINPTRLGKDGFPHPPASNSPIQGTLFLIEIPSDISEIKAQDLELALDWRFHTRALFAESFEKGYIVTDFIYLKGEQIPRSYYVLSHGKGTLG
jgi:predicted GNAT superfamily acetyltransferase